MTSTVDYTQKIFPAACLTFEEVMEFIGISKRVRELIYCPGATIEECFEVMEFESVCMMRGFYPTYDRRGLFGEYEDKHIDISPIAAEDMYILVSY